MFVTKLNPTGSALVYSTFLGGTDDDDGQRSGWTAAATRTRWAPRDPTDFPTTAGAFDTDRERRVEVTPTKLNPAGSALVDSTYLGGDGGDDGSGLVSTAPGAPSWRRCPIARLADDTAGAHDRHLQQRDGYAQAEPGRIRPWVFSTLIGGSSGCDSISDTVLDPAATLAHRQYELGPDFPAHRRGAPDATFTVGGPCDDRRAQRRRTALLFADVPGGSHSEGGTDIGRDPTGDIYVTGIDPLAELPGDGRRVRPGRELRPRDLLGDAFITKIDIDATTSTPIAPPGSGRADPGPRRPMAHRSRSRSRSTGTTCRRWPLHHPDR